MSDPGGRIAAAAIDQPFVTDVFVALQEPAEELLHLGMLIDQRIEVSRLADHDLAANDRLDAVMSSTRPRKNSLAGKAKRDDLPAAGRVRLEFREYSRTHEHDFVARAARLTERPSRLDMQNSVRNRIQQVGQTRLQSRGDQGLPKRCSLSRRFRCAELAISSPPRNGRYAYATQVY